MLTKIDRNQWTNVWEHGQEKTRGVAIRKSSEITELSGSNGVRTFRRSWSLLADT